MKCVYDCNNKLKYDDKYHFPISSSINKLKQMKLETSYKEVSYDCA